MMDGTLNTEVHPNTTPKHLPMKVSNCCGADGSYSFMVAWATYEDADLCPKCGEHCEYIEETDLNTINTENEQRTDED